LRPAIVERNEFFKFADFKPDDVVWDFGCGDGRYEYPVSKVYSTDIDKGEAPGTHIDKFIMLCVLHYIRTKDLYLSMAYNQLRRGGHIIIIEPNPYNPFFYCLYFWRWITRSKCPRRWNKEKYTLPLNKLIDLLYSEGFSNIEVKRYAWFPSKFGWLKLNEILNMIPFVNYFNAFNWIKAVK
jgi:SAM-dependent methyltransferase